MGRLRNLLISGVDKSLLLKDAVKTMPDLTNRSTPRASASAAKVRDV